MSEKKDLSSHHKVALACFEKYLSQECMLIENKHFESSKIKVLAKSVAKVIAKHKKRSLNEDLKNYLNEVHIGLTKDFFDCINEVGEGKNSILFLFVDYFFFDMFINHNEHSDEKLPLIFEEGIVDDISKSEYNIENIIRNAYDLLVVGEDKDIFKIFATIYVTYIKSDIP